MYRLTASAASTSVLSRLTSEPEFEFAAEDDLLRFDSLCASPDR